MSRFIIFLFALLLSLPAQQAHADLNRDVQDWLLLRQSARNYDFSNYQQFLAAHPDWPESSAIQIKAEAALVKNATTGQVIKWFKSFSPVTDSARLNYVQALASMSDRSFAESYLRSEWRAGKFNEDLQQKIMTNFYGWLKPEDHAQRLDSLLWQGNLDRAEKTLSYITDPTVKQIGRSRIALQRNSSSALIIVNGMNQTARMDNGVILDLARYYRQHDMDSKAIATLAQRRQDITLNSATWWRERSLLARRALEKGNFRSAYDIARGHGFVSGAELAEAEWISGWLAVTRLKNPQQAFTHFEHMYRNVKTPISIARAAYWAGIAGDQMRNKPLALQWYRIASQHMNTFYGQLAAYALAEDTNTSPKQYFAAFFARSKSPNDFPASLVRQDMIGAARILHKMGKEKERNAFLLAALRKAQESTNPNAPAAIIAAAKSMNADSVALMAAKASYEKGVLVGDALFPRPSVPKNNSVETALTLGIIRQESQFDRFAMSPAGARGLMQLMPATARQTARQSGINHGDDSQLFQPAHNMMLGQAYLGKMLNHYDGFVPLAAAAYNGGPGNVNKWLDQMGDPRRDPYSWVDWVERIPFYETRNYVQRVWESYATYQYLASR